MMAMSYYKYGPVKVNMQERLTDMIPTIEKRWEKYKETGNTEFLADIANMCMMEWRYPQHPKAHYKPTDSNESPGIVGWSVNQMKEFERNVEL